MKHRVVVVTGGFDPIHSGHLEYLRCAKSLGDTLVVGLNTDDWLTRKKGKPFLPMYEREQVLNSIRHVDNVVHFNDDDNTAINCIEKILKIYSQADIIFANGGDRTENNTPEYTHFKDHDRIRFEYNVGGSKTNSSSIILDKWSTNHTERPWGYYRVLHNESGVVKVKELVVMPRKNLSMQRHENRAEHWFITSGVATVYTINKRTTDYELLGEYNKFDNLHIARGEWHMLSNETDSPLRIVEIQYGTSCSEEDIERK
jgi:cytidyltransferase-like protein